MTDFGTLRASVKAIGTASQSTGEFEAILSTTATDRDGETIGAGAFRPLPTGGIPVYHHHDWMQKAMPIGRATPYYEGDVLKAKGYFASTPRAQEVRTLVNEGVVHAMSVGYLVQDFDTRTKTIRRADLIEASFTAIPSNVGALVTASKTPALLTAEELRLRSILADIDRMAGTAPIDDELAIILCGINATVALAEVDSSSPAPGGARGAHLHLGSDLRDLSSLVR